ncbi:MAG: phosphoethanolamine transferase domain-containing protein [Steroidobacteraceae bacterium]|jgi:hypothetical protein|nr:phosphoethanolamine transferase domain-containing protein [Steroidobacteraceae bacterium]
MSSCWEYCPPHWYGESGYRAFIGASSSRSGGIAFIASVTIVMFGMIANSAQYATFLREHKPVRYTLNPTAQIASMAALLAGSDAAPNQPLIDPAGTIEHTSAAAPKPLVLFLVIGETARAANFQLGGYERATKPVDPTPRRPMRSSRNGAHASVVSTFRSMMYSRARCRALLTLEERFYSSWQPLKLFNVGAAVFVDAGRSWGQDEHAATPAGWLEDVGVGLRLGSARSGLGNVLHIDLAMPLNRTNDIETVGSDELPAAPQRKIV